jgi:hypothetical protein
MQSTKGRSLQEQDNLEWSLRPFGVVGGCVQNCSTSAVANRLMFGEGVVGVEAASPTLDCSRLMSVEWEGGTDMVKTVKESVHRMTSHLTHKRLPGNEGLHQGAGEDEGNH